MLKKTCKTCKEEKDLTKDNFNYVSNDNYWFAECKICKAKRAAENRIKRSNSIKPTIYKKICTVCKEEKTIDHFMIKSESSDGYFNTCKGCENESARAYYKENRQHVRDRMCVGRKSRNITAQNKNIEIKTNTPCAICNKKFHPYAMDWDHIDPKTKSYEISEMIASGYSWHLIESEMKKCQLLCALCHKEKTHKKENYKAVYNASQMATIWARSFPCNKCGQQHNWYQHELDHLDPTTKISGVGQLVFDKAPFEDVVNEINKCQNLCIICHREKSFDNRDVYREESLERHEKRIVSIKQRLENGEIKISKKYKSI